MHHKIGIKEQRDRVGLGISEKKLNVLFYRAFKK
jgi:hypothetical protein